MIVFLFQTYAKSTSGNIGSTKSFWLEYWVLSFMRNSEDLLRKEFIHLLSDTLALLGAEKGLVEEIKAMEENPFSLKLIDKIRKYNREQSDKAKAAVALLNTTFSYPGK